MYVPPIRERLQHCPENKTNFISVVMLKWAAHVARIEEGRNAFKILTGKPTGHLWRPSRRWEENIRMDLTEIGLSRLRIGIIREPF